MKAKSVCWTGNEVTSELAHEDGKTSKGDQLIPPFLALDVAPARELGFWRQFILTTPGIALALRLGLKGQELKASPGAILLTMMPTLWGPLLLYLFVGYPLGMQLYRIRADTG